MKELKQEIEQLKRTIECLQSDYYDEIQVTTDIMIMQENFMNYLVEKKRIDTANKKIYNEIIKEFEKIMI